jgi:hypothetical protein
MASNNDWLRREKSEKCPMCCDAPMTAEVLARYVNNPSLLSDSAAEAILVLADRLMQAGYPSGEQAWAKVLDDYSDSMRRNALGQPAKCAGCLTCPECVAEVAAAREAHGHE